MNHFSKAYDKQEPEDVKTHFKPFFTPLHRTHDFFKHTAIDLERNNLQSRKTNQRKSMDNTNLKKVRK